MTKDQPDLRQTQMTKTQKQIDKEDLGKTTKTRRPETVTVVLWTSSHILYGLSLYQNGNVSKATC